ncbi:MAG: response regulator, partial [Bacteroidales bacterium]|nr:response regulator [Bacteroidales bacterium]
TEALRKNRNKGEPAQDTLLIVEDNEALRYYLRQTFDKDYRVLDVANGQEALASLDNEYPDLILSDVMMPGIQGNELCRMVKDNPDTSGIPFVLLTAKTNHDATVEGLKMGADDYIPKPFSTEILKLKVQGLIENRKRQRAFFMREALRQVGTVETREVPEKDAGLSDPPVPTLSDNDRRFVERATNLVIENISNSDFNIDSLCREMAMSRTLFYNRLKSLTGKSPQEFIRLIRLQKAAELLKNGKSVTETAMDCGFVNPKYFSSLFKHQFGVQPSKYLQ